MHSLLKRQLKKFFGSELQLPEEVRQFVAAVDASYQSFDSDQELLHRAMELNSEELTQANSELRAVFEAIPDLILRLDREGNIVALKAAEAAPADPEAHRFNKRRISSKLMDISDPAIREPFQNALHAMLQDRQAKTFEYSTSSELGENFFEVRLMPLQADHALAIIQDITERKQTIAEHERLNEQLIKASRQAGMEEIATGVLHNVGNVLNSVNVAAGLLRDKVGQSQIPNLVKATNLLREHADDAAAFLTTDPKGLRLPGYLIKLGDHLAGEQQLWQQELEGLGKNIEHIKEIVAMQQNYARLSGASEVLDVEDLLEDALRMNESMLYRSGLRVQRQFQPVEPVSVDKHKVLQILVNLIHNARHAMKDSSEQERTLTVSIDQPDPTRVRVQVRDRGIGIPPENLTRIFQHGFTTKQEGHGFGLHSGANAAKEMGGSLCVRSDGPGTGATFTLELPTAGQLSGLCNDPLPAEPLANRIKI